MIQTLGETATSSSAWCPPVGPLLKSYGSVMLWAGCPCLHTEQVTAAEKSHTLRAPADPPSQTPHNWNAVYHRHLYTQQVALMPGTGTTDLALDVEVLAQHMTQAPNVTHQALMFSWMQLLK